MLLKRLAKLYETKNFIERFKLLTLKINENMSLHEAWDGH